jgi:hypothetical protein
VARKLRGRRDSVHPGEPRVFARSDLGLTDQRGAD